jgi:hypothetical protein
VHRERHGGAASGEAGGLFSLITVRELRFLSAELNCRLLRSSSSAELVVMKSGNFEVGGLR